MTRPIKLGLLLETPGAAYHSWMHPGTPRDAATSLAAAQRLVELAESANFAFAFMADNVSMDLTAKPYYVNRLEPITALSALAAVTSRIGLVATISTTFSPPYTAARQLGSLDVLSGGRAGFNAVTSALASAAANFGDDALIDHDQRYAKAAEFMEVVRGLWDSFEDDALVRDVTTRTYLDVNRVHALDHKGEYFSVTGPMNLIRSPQGHPVMFQAGTSSSGRDFAARYAEAIFAREFDIESARVSYRDLKDRAAAHGRKPEHIQVFTGAQFIVGKSRGEAEDKYQTVLSYVNDDDALNNLAGYYNHADLSKYDLDGPFPEISHLATNFHRGLAEKYEREAARRQLTLRQTAHMAAYLEEDFFGTPVEVVDAMEAWMEAEATDGFLVHNWLQPEGLQDFVTLIVPELRRRGLYQDGYQGSTLREHLGLPFVPNRYAEDRLGPA
ncbi:NtaA/DmoA family FMN-dependent monooxygenase [Pseudonocardia sp. RS010]|uniref:NtaA/DmoA family FMN-dependent monooxygenase n=1 Tax=Pseudonocardia sp. RS010 TaxID=3385979 RepID=UPI00399FAE65